MNESILAGAVLLAIAGALIFVALPDKNHESPRFLRFHSAMVVYPPFVLVFLVSGATALVMGILNIAN
jgi:hypothetical protein